MRLNPFGLLRLQVGDAVKVNGETVLVDHVNESGARVVPLARKAVTLKTRFGDETKAFEVSGEVIHDSAARRARHPGGAARGAVAQRLPGGPSGWPQGRC